MEGKGIFTSFNGDIYEMIGKMIKKMEMEL
jgi:hypothetical protein